MGTKELWSELSFELGGVNVMKLEGVKDTKLFLGSGNKSADILFIADDPDLYEDEDGRFTIGSTGEFFSRLCDVTDLMPNKYYVTNLSKCVLRWKSLSEREKNQMIDLLDMQIAIMKPKIIVTLGQDVTSIIMKKEVKIAEARGKIHSYLGGIKLIPTFDPSYVKRSRDTAGKKSKPAVEFWSDLKVIKLESEM